MNPIDLIIPVYRGLAETRACIDSVIASQNVTPFQIIVFNDASPEPAIADYLEALVRDGKIFLLTNANNLGFVATVNRALALDSDNDVLLLNSDTEVSGDWLDRIVACAARDHNIASVTPFSNNATLCSYPTIGESAPMPHAAELRTLDQLFAAHNAGASVDLPTGVGFCLWMRRAAINAIGNFDEAAFGRGYGEENDWCYRASAAGYRHVLCADVFVAHQGEVSFGNDSTGRKANAQAVIDARYPQYRDDIAAFFEHDPARPLRRAVDMARIKTSSRPRVLMVQHGWGGGTERHVRDLAKLIEDDCEVLLLQPERGGLLALRWARAGEECLVYFRAETEFDALVALLAHLGIDRVHLHHVHGLPMAILSLAERLNVPLDITLHDYFPITPLYHLLPGAVVADESHAGVRDHAWRLTLAEWRATFAKLLASAARVTSPSRDLAERIRAYLLTQKIDIWPHVVLETPRGLGDFKVLLLGGLTPEKGLDVLEACVELAHEHQLPLAFTILGHTSRPVAQWPYLPLTITGSYREQDLARRIDIERADVFLFPSQIPESFSYTLSAAMATGKPIVASRLGAFPERLASYPAATLIDWNAATLDWVNAIMHACAGRRLDNAPAASDDAAQYRARYLQPIQPPSQLTLTAASAAVSATHFYFKLPPGPEREYSLQDLLSAGVYCGHLDSRNELDRRVVIADQKIADASRVLTEVIRQRDEALEHFPREIAKLQEAKRVAVEELETTMQAHRIALESERDQARQAFHRIESSTSWRLTAPMRWVMQHAKQGAARAARGTRNLPRYSALSAQILREEGPAALVRRVRVRLGRKAGFVAPNLALIATEAKIGALEFRECAAPLVSLIIPVYEQHLLTFTCLKSIAETCGDLDIEVIVIDDCSPTPASQALAEVHGVQFVRNAENLGFLRNCNLGAARARGNYVSILNNDIVLTKGWLAAMLDVFAAHPDAGLVGAKLIYPDGRLQEAGGIVWRDGSAWNFGRNDDASAPEYNYLREVDYCSGACLLLAKKLWDQLDGFDERYVPAYFEDTDLAFRVRAAGKKVFYQPHATVVHFEGQSSGTDLTQGVKQHQVTNQATFAARWQHVLGGHRVNGVMPQQEKDRYSKQRVLVVDACMLTPDQDSGSLRMFEMLCALRELQCKVTFVADNLEHREPYVSQIQGQGVEVLYHPYTPSITKFLEASGADFDVIVLSRATVACKYVDLVKRVAPRARLVFDTVDLHFLREERKAELEQSTAARAVATLTRKQELDAMARADLTLVVSPIEQQLLNKLVPSVKVEIVSNIHATNPGPKKFRERDGILFIGGFRHPPNLDAVYWYAEHVLPILRDKVPGIVTTIIGSNAPASLQKLAAPDFVIAGFVEDVKPYYDNATLSISPLRYGAGVKGKVNLAMQYGVPVVATPVSAEGMYLEDGVNVLIGESPEQFADAVIRLHTDEALWNRLSKAGLDNIETHFSRQCAREALARVLGQTIGSVDADC